MRRYPLRLRFAIPGTRPLHSWGVLLCGLAQRSVLDDFKEDGVSVSRREQRKPVEGNQICEVWTIFLIGAVVLPAKLGLLPLPERHATT
ncbi:hypothetical protein CONLIGDRAFT_680013 [Coniochaeta ligniaria NRRL 30616]|uniref:Uncharacterized protein n=1 Tax=Coniochaeta ligniaria NRRL 30616 TaxID=1408157 RepID=A0A1J7JU80_9PEZI|nr:hypothetical protein CONLIGDRAFT_680013 [Coniochaeta ligniaria NRRL 30616]